VSDGGAVGVVCTDHGPNPMLLDNLPMWLTHEEFEASVEVKDLDRQGQRH
jgi:hypothetical protein